jgi:hypothetical protein
MRKQEIVNYLSSMLPSVLENLAAKLSEGGRLVCEFVVSAGGLMSAREARLRVSIHLLYLLGEDGTCSDLVGFYSPYLGLELVCLPQVVFV